MLASLVMAVESDAINDTCLLGKCKQVCFCIGGVCPVVPRSPVDAKGTHIRTGLVCGSIPSFALGQLDVPISSHRVIPTAGLSRRCWDD